ncbi:hypothetical protein [Pseudanabaena sp. ABRG5-3]|uniref:hypothetical protein n=1 Tax=Pseudanabaena sp. ABRG5-3 TaxID=685565 RepID=UPI000DC6ED13|nr:hypothetical protein [Pseudanabaena sp. ABRG5-3]BBC26928.1 hypothetical protein ABRG53_c089 [Pseudanabaena sp. ABRG5-3]
MSRHVWEKTNPILEFGIGVAIASFLAISLQQFGVIDLIYDVGFTRVITINKTNK